MEGSFAFDLKVLESKKPKVVSGITDFRVHMLEAYNPKEGKLGLPSRLPYFSSPSLISYPLDLTIGFEKYIFRGAHISNPYGNAISFMMKNDIYPSGEKFDIITNRRTMIGLMMFCKVNKPKHFPLRFGALKVRATRYCGSIFVSIVDLESERFQPMTKRSTFQFKLRQYVFADKPGGEVDIDIPIDERKQVYATVSMKLGNLRVLYSPEIAGVDNKEQLNNFTDTDEINKLRFLSVKLLHEKFDGPNRFNCLRWVCQASLTAIENIKVGYFDDSGIIRRPLENHSTASLQRTYSMDIRFNFLHSVLYEIARVMNMHNVDSPDVTFIFDIKYNVVQYKTVTGPEHSGIGAEFIEFVQKKQLPDLEKLKLTE